MPMLEFAIGTRAMIRTQFIVLVFTIMNIIGCASNATLLRDTPTGGMVSYPFETDSDILTTAGRRTALRLIGEKCPQGSRIIKEGEIPKVSKKADRAWQGQITSERVWAIEFTCV